MSKRIVLQKRVPVSGTVSASSTDELFPWDMEINGGQIEDFLADVSRYSDCILTLQIVDAAVTNARDTLAIVVKTVDSVESLREGGTANADGTTFGPSWVVKSMTVPLGGALTLQNSWAKHSSTMRDADDSAETHPMDRLMYYSVLATGSPFGGGAWSITFQITVTLQNPS